MDDGHCSAQWPDGHAAVELRRDGLTSSTVREQAHITSLPKHTKHTHSHIYTFLFFLLTACSPAYYIDCEQLVTANNDDHHQHRWWCTRDGTSAFGITQHVSHLAFASVFPFPPSLFALFRKLFTLNVCHSCCTLRLFIWLRFLLVAYTFIYFRHQPHTNTHTDSCTHFPAPLHPCFYRISFSLFFCSSPLTFEPRCKTHTHYFLPDHWILRQLSQSSTTLERKVLTQPIQPTSSSPFSLLFLI